MKCMVCENPKWTFIECYREVSGLEYKLLQRLCDEHKSKILAMEITEEIKTKEVKEKPKLTLEQMRDKLY